MIRCVYTINILNSSGLVYLIKKNAVIKKENLLKNKHLKCLKKFSRKLKNVFSKNKKKNFLFQLVAVFTLIIVLLTEDVTGNILIFMTTQFFMIFLLTQHLLSVL